MGPPIAYYRIKNLVNYINNIKDLHLNWRGLARKRSDLKALVKTISENTVLGFRVNESNDQLLKILDSTKHVAFRWDISVEACKKIKKWYGYAPNTQNTQPKTKARLEKSE